MSNAVKIHDAWFEPYISADQLNARIKLVGEAINKDYAQLNPLFVAVLKGSVFFSTELLKHFDGECEVDFIKVSSYEQMTSTGYVHESMGLTTSLQGRHVIILEDIVDTGLTLQTLVEQFQRSKPASIRIASMTMKPDALQTSIKVPYLGFELPNEFVVGYGLDYDQQGRNLHGIYKLKR
jgi:hypoxanthine phosphoribosyltransferase